MEVWTHLAPDVLRRASAAADLTPPYSGPGAMRHHCATWAVDGGYTRDQVALVLGHARPGATTRYVHSQAVAVKSEVLEYVESVWLAALNA